MIDASHVVMLTASLNIRFRLSMYWFPLRQQVTSWTTPHCLIKPVNMLFLLFQAELSSFVRDYEGVIDRQSLY